jgi:hypothetical protein
MNARQNNKIRMYLSITNHCTKTEHQAAVNHIPAFASEYQLFEPIPAKILEAIRRQQGTLSAGITEDKNVVRASMADQGARIAAAIQTCADIAGDRTLLASVNYTYTDLFGGREIDAANLAENILLIASTKLASLGDYGVNQILLNEFDATIEQFSRAIGKPRARIIERKNVTDHLPGFFTQADKHLARLDRLVKLLEMTHPDFVLGYKNARPIVTSRGSQSVAAASAAAVSVPTQPVLLPTPVAGDFTHEDEVDSNAA